MDLAFTPEQMIQAECIDPMIFGSIRTKEQVQKLAGLLLSGLISLYLMYSLRATFLVRFGVFGLVMPAGVVLFGLLAFKEICDLFSLLTIWSMIDSSELRMSSAFVPVESEQIEESRLKKKVRFVGLPPAPPKRRRSTSLPPILPPTQSSSTTEAKESSLLSTIIAYFYTPKEQTQIDADELLTSAWGSE
eukprot:TRINITY_DN5830_c0_g1_i1.p1 TRINITY_DN5830_c0_g1~~TRINITY_DN5830_c0_g1_i1.p1  ORF type:complete len:190 (-),score=29.91 TRINITY_DN5830_c0_g1_i1:139-708(-)